MNIESSIAKSTNMTTVLSVEWVGSWAGGGGEMVLAYAQMRDRDEILVS